MGSTPVQLCDDDFAVLGIDRQFGQNDTELQKRWQTLQAQAHPDRFAAQGGAAQRIATQWSVRINEAYQRIKNPVTRAALLCELAGETINSEINTAMPGDFLMQQMQWREALEEASTCEAAEALQEMVAQERAQKLSVLESLIDEKGDYQQAAQQIRALMFIDRFIDSIDSKLDAFGL